MANKTIYSRVINKHDTEANWLKATNFKPKEGEIIIYDADDDNANARLKVGDGQTAVSNLPFVVDYNETIIALSIEGTTLTYIKGDGSVHTFEIQDTDTTYSLGTDSVTGLTKLYATTGTAEDGTMTQKAIKTELDKKVGVSIDNASDMLVFTI